MTQGYWEAHNRLCAYLDWYYEEFSPGQMERLGIYRDKNGNYQKIEDFEKLMEQELIEKSKELAFLLRHDPKYVFNDFGWREVSDLTNYHGYTIEMLNKIVSEDSKGRYEFNEDKSCIRARQGHSIKVDVELEEKEPPEFLYHGTATRFLELIKEEGIKKMSRQYVQLSSDIETATEVGKRHGEPVILKILTGQMFRDGIKFYLSRNNVWLTDYIDPKYFVIC